MPASATGSVSSSPLTCGAARVGRQPSGKRSSSAAFEAVLASAGAGAADRFEVGATSHPTPAPITSATPSTTSGPVRIAGLLGPGCGRSRTGSTDGAGAGIAFGATVAGHSSGWSTTLASSGTGGGGSATGSTGASVGRLP